MCIVAIESQPTLAEGGASPQTSPMRKSVSWGMVEFQTVFAKLEEEERSEEQTPGIASVPKPCSADEEDEDTHELLDRWLVKADQRRMRRSVVPSVTTMSTPPVFASTNTSSLLMRRRQQRA